MEVKILLPSFNEMNGGGDSNGFFPPFYKVEKLWLQSSCILWGGRRGRNVSPVRRLLYSPELIET
jgi:hypothetical protein